MQLDSLSWQEPQDDRGISFFSRKLRLSLKYFFFWINQDNNAQTLTADEDELLFVISKDIHYIFFNSFLLGAGRVCKIINCFTQFHETV